ncbi:hypothetical protein Q787_09810 [Ornithobacterium rhinotracheale H06-030791]|nr:hypothetical protein Q785_09980 [Ornithobacterium rhinotracheale ORT-UMN 88]KGB66347.1 hypothetical protein Q787_09810 [Ornithobacterium rhinotracheale H06-030791]
MNFKKGWNAQWYSTNSFSLNSEGTIQVEATFLFTNRTNFQIFTVEPQSWLNLGMKMQFLDKKLQVTAKLEDVFKSGKVRATTYTSGIEQKYSNYYDNQFFLLGLSYKFGNDKIRVNERTSGNEDEQNRAN